MEAPSTVSILTTRDRIVTALLGVRPRLEAKGVRHSALFGSVARGDDGADSDVDVVLDLDPAAHVDLFELASMYLLLTTELAREVDIVTRRTLRPERHAEILGDLFDVF